MIGLGMDKWQTLDDVDFTVYDATQRREVNLEFSAFLKAKVLKIPLSELVATEERVRQVEQVTEAFYSHFGQHMNSTNLYFLSNYLMQDFIKMPKRNKTMNEENGFFTPQQLAERQRREVSMQSKGLSYHRTKRLFPDLMPQQRCTVNTDIDMEKE